MGFLSDIKDRFFDRRLQAEAKKPRKDSAGGTVHPSSAKDITVLFLADSAEDRKAVDKWRDANAKSGRKIKVVGYFDLEVGSTSFDFTTISVKDLNWYGVPRGEEVTRFQAEPTELLLRLGPTEHKILDFLAATKSAGLKVGPFSGGDHHPYQLQYDARNSPKLRDQFEAIAQIFSYTNAH
ncbi:hypothetical protein FUA23_13520 [Neolewinella aurantiaca]|uniref:Uncharacterized protein n=1 Tax=Neolewinella aurantiaca TaxID=2602767 RepID=A0A5C7FG46_9BACT|nr:hypothetical protein [Neolewinella aurantiaca]TXF88680.1 hypothetical protein FUA23_13520 [Neolewinella aurantiaca]